MNEDRPTLTNGMRAVLHLSSLLVLLAAVFFGWVGGCAIYVLTHK